MRETPSQGGARRVPQRGGPQAALVFEADVVEVDVAARWSPGTTWARTGAHPFS
ncbi:hypothetical protein [Streptomyces sp. NPDC060027]|uniref:hypothetical protein n=1 Tax=Streptomyces sp. NPDC060027 TaxID=3347040 RepID=UPI0036CE91DC